MSCACRYLSDEASSAALHDSVDDCNACPEGKFLTDGGTSAALHDAVEDCDMTCPAGTSTPSEGASSAGECSLVCPAGTYSDGVQTNACTACPGSYLVDAATSATEHDALSDCTACPAGKSTPASTAASDHDSPDDCSVDCTAGRYSDGSTVTAGITDGCLQCSEGTFSGPAATVCTSCLPGKYSLGNDCLDCPVNHPSPTNLLPCANP